MQLKALRLRPGDDLRAALMAWTRAEGMAAAAMVSAVGSLRHVGLRLADDTVCAHLAGPFEIVSLVGTLGGGRLHLHTAVADRAGQVIGGHLLLGSAVHTTVEVVVCVLEALEFRRTFDPATGFDELEVVGRAAGQA